MTGLRDQLALRESDSEVARSGRFEERVVRAAEAALAERGYVSPIDVLVGIGWLHPRRIDEWRQGRVDCLEPVTMVNLHKLSDAMRLLRRFARGRGLVPSETAYLARTRDRRSLGFGGRDADPARAAGEPAVRGRRSLQPVAQALRAAGDPRRGGGARARGAGMPGRRGGTGAAAGAGGGAAGSGGRGAPSADRARDRAA